MMILFSIRKTKFLRAKVGIKKTFSIVVNEKVMKSK
jgi:hypothetical protein